MLRSVISAFTRVFDALWRCAADPGHKSWVPACAGTTRGGIEFTFPLL